MMMRVLRQRIIVTLAMVISSWEAAAFVSSTPFAPYRAAFVQQTTRLAVATVDSSSSSSSSSSSPLSSDTTGTTSRQGNGSDRGTDTASTVLDMPWGDAQSWSLRDHVARYTVQVPVTINNVETIRAYTLWRTMCSEVTELTGYPLPFVVDRYQKELEEQERNNAAEDDSSPLMMATTEILPFLDEFEFESSGGLTGLAYGVAGVADGSRIQTVPVGDVRSSVPKGFVRTADGSVVYELGKPAASAAVEAAATGYSLDAAKNVQEAARTAVRDAAKSLTTFNDGNDKLTRQQSPAQLDPDLVRLGGLTAIVLGGALAVDLLSHHLTINVFWV